MEGRPSVIRGDSVFIRKLGDNVKYEGVVHLVEQNKLFVMPNKSFLENYINEKVNVEFSFNRYCLRICHRALDQINKRSVGQVLFPTKFGTKKQSPEASLKYVLVAFFLNNMSVFNRIVYFFTDLYLIHKLRIMKNKRKPLRILLIIPRFQHLILSMVLPVPEKLPLWLNRLCKWVF